MIHDTSFSKNWKTDLLPIIILGLVSTLVMWFMIPHAARTEKQIYCPPKSFSRPRPFARLWVLALLVAHNKVYSNDMHQIRRSRNLFPWILVSYKRSNKITSSLWMSINKIFYGVPLWSIMRELRAVLSRDILPYCTSVRSTLSIGWNEVLTRTLQEIWAKSGYKDHLGLL